jgi:ssDNA-binding Zn-finger/Zn-ribbon topoisomerase 1
VETDELVTKRREVRTCPACGGPVTKRAGKYGEFYGCNNHPRCKEIAKTARVEEYQAPRLALARWTPYTWTEMDERAEEAAERAERVEGFERWLQAIRWKRAR